MVTPTPGNPTPLAALRAAVEEWCEAHLGQLVELGVTAVVVEPHATPTHGLLRVEWCGTTMAFALPATMQELPDLLALFRLPVPWVKAALQVADGPLTLARLFDPAFQPTVQHRVREVPALYAAYMDAQIAQRLQYWVLARQDDLHRRGLRGAEFDRVGHEHEVVHWLLVRSAYDAWVAGLQFTLPTASAAPEGYGGRLDIQISLDLPGPIGALVTRWQRWRRRHGVPRTIEQELDGVLQVLHRAMPWVAAWYRCVYPVARVVAALGVSAAAVAGAEDARRAHRRRASGRHRPTGGGTGAGAWVRRAVGMPGLLRRAARRREC